MMPAVSAPATSAIDRVPPVALVITGIGSVQFGAALATTLFDELGPSGATLLRLFFGAALLVVVWRPDPRAYERAQLRLIGAFGLVLGLMNFTFYLALDRLPLGVAVTVEFIGPLGVAVLTSKRRTDLFWAGLAAVGIVLLTNPGGASVDTLGLALAALAGLFWAAYILLAQAAGPSFQGGAGVTLAMVVALLVPLVPGAIGGGTAFFDPTLLIVGFGVAVLSSVIPYSLEFEALRRIPANVFGVLMSLEPGVAALAGLLVLGQSLGALQLVAIALVVAASVGVTRAARRADGLLTNS
ncbi:MAG: EamA family transporter [Solirubrobacterales bacterium]|nr:EamA family transporter [Solirubrobacterales bacterium]